MDKEVKWLLTNGAKPVPGTNRWSLGEIIFTRRGLNRWEVLSHWLYELKVNRVWASPEAALAWICAYREKQNVEFHEDVGKYVSPRALARGRGILTRQHNAYEKEEEEATKKSKTEPHGRHPVPH